MKAINNVQEFNALMEQGKPVFLDFYADWCGPCRSLMPVVEKAAEKYEGQIEIRKVNVDKFPELAQKFSVRSIPALFLIEDKTVVEQHGGYKSKAQLDQILSKYAREVA